MIVQDRKGARRVPRGGGFVRATTAASAAMLVLGGLAINAGAATSPTLKSVNITGYSGVLANKASHTLYLLTTEKGAKLHCKAACLKTWPPLLVKSSAKTVAVGIGVKGKVGFVRRSATTKQVTFNTYPVYVYSGDSGQKQSNGEGIVADGGTWLMLSAAAMASTSTPVLPIAAQLKSKSVANYPGILANRSSGSLYLLSVEKGGVLQCTGPCNSIWVPLEVTSNTATPVLTAGVKGTIGFVTRGPSLFQVTFNSYPVYRYVNDPNSKTVNGEGLVEDGGTWYLLKASATTPAATPVLPFGGY